MLFNSKTFNNGLFNGGQSIATVYSTDLVVFEGFSLSDGTNMIVSEKLDSGPNRELIGGNITRGNGMYVTGSYFRERIIELSGVVKASSAEALLAYMDRIRQTLATQEGNLDITEDGVVKRYIATCVNYDTMFQREHYHITICPFTIRFSCRTPFGLARDYNVDYQSFTTSPSNQSIVTSGSYAAEPVFILSFSAASGVSSVEIENLTTGESITYSGYIAAGDLLIVDCEQKEVTLNGVAVNFSGLFPSLPAGTSLIQFTINGTFTLGATTKNRDTYL
jgi:phage-related protein